MAGLLAWAADVVGGHGKEEDGEKDQIPLVFSAEQKKYAEELDRKAAALSRSIQDLRLRLPPPDISQRLPHLLAHSLASNAALALQLNSHSATREQAQLREQTLLEENSAYEKAISNCESKIQEKRQEADSLLRKLKELEDAEENLTDELEDAQVSLKNTQTRNSGESVYQSDANSKDGSDAEAEKFAILEKLESKKKELSSMEEQVQYLEKKWAVIQERALKQPSPAQREKTLDKQLHSLIEQLAAKQAQAEGLVGEIHSKEMELERLNGLWRRYESSNIEGNNARNRFARTNSDKGSVSDHEVDAHSYLPYSSAPRNDTQTRLMYLRSAFVIYILALHVLVFIKISF
ncbi:PREDICTED: golgin subfamily A member 2 isoform X2 [Tarenaya hassleriana]|uniref:golgin subfamily A member 2 isoform X1 n=1 Tax=Tarenaya hassleriana TaxID=28532 RepID=UPI00053C6712|nr:PREDICTED: golgin subfamily A member 2 isoform X1 [Tarenaya hassleriana]XP_010525142.1 PREDICTED: golgin subfamily A member 2 isoform X2 [Tarenaya hassleriana]